MQRALRDTIHSSTIVSKCIGDDGNILNSKQEKKEEIWLSPMTKAPTPTEKSIKQRDNTKTSPNYTTIAIRLRTVSWDNDSHPTGVVKPVYGIPTLPLTAKAV